MVVRSLVEWKSGRGDTLTSGWGTLTPVWWWIDCGWDRSTPEDRTLNGVELSPDSEKGDEERGGNRDEDAEREVDTPSPLLGKKLVAISVGGPCVREIMVGDSPVRISGAEDAQPREELEIIWMIPFPLVPLLELLGIVLGGVGCRVEARFRSARVAINKEEVRNVVVAVLLEVEEGTADDSVVSGG